MKVVEPIRDIDTVFAVADFLYSKSVRDYMLFMVGINTGLRISDILELKVGELKGKTKLVVREKKTGKVKEIPINADLRRAVKAYTLNLPPNAWMFPSQKGKGVHHIKRSRAYKVLREAAEVFGIPNVGTHTLRKTFGYHFYHQSGRDVTLLMYIFNHSDPNITLRYIGVTSTLAYDAMKRFSLFAR